MGNLADVLEDMQVAAEADFSYPAHIPDWLKVGSALICVTCGKVGFSGHEDLPGTVLPSGVVFRGGQRLDSEAEDFYRQEQWS